MKTDLFTKLILLVITICLVMLVIKGVTIMVKFEYPITRTQMATKMLQEEQSKKGAEEYDMIGIPKAK